MTTLSWKDADTVVKRVRMYVETIVLVGGVTLAVSTFMARTITASVKSEIADVRADVAHMRHEQQAQAVTDSIRFQKLAEVVELVAAGVAEPPGSDEQRNAVVELRRLRHVAP